MFSQIDEVKQIISDVFKKLQPYDPLDLLINIAALQLCPENADHAIRLDALAFTAACLNYEGGKPQISRHRIDRICNDHPLGDGWIKLQEDTCEAPFTEAFTFFGGSYTVFPGIVEKATFSLKYLLSAIFRQSAFEEHEQLLEKIHNITLTILILSDLMAKRSGLIRNLEPIQSRNVFIPPNLDILKQAVYFSIEDLTNILGKYHLSIDDVTPFIQEVSDMNVGMYSPITTPLHKKPIIHVGNMYIVSEPGILLASLRFQILLDVKNAGLITLLSQEYQKAVLYTAESSLHLFGMNKIHDDFFKETDRPFIHDGLWTFDFDKALYMAVSTDDFSNFVGEKVIEINPNENLGDLLEKYFSNIEEMIYCETANLNEVFFVVVFAGIGREYAVGFKLDKFITDPKFLVISAEELEVLSLICPENALILYKFARDLATLRIKTHFVSFSALDQFAVYRNNDFSFYISDNSRPDFITFFPGEGKSLRLEALRKKDIHAVPYWKPESFIEVYNQYDTQNIPIYSPILNKPSDEWFVELNPISFWVIIENKNIKSDVSLFIPRPTDIIDMITYWLWQFSEELKNFLEDIYLRHPPAIIVEINDNENWKERDGGILIEQYPSPLTYILNPKEIQIRISIHPSVLPILSEADNNNELKCMNTILKAIGELMDNLDGKTRSQNLSKLISIIYSKHSGIPFKKKLLVLNSENVPQLAPGNPHPFRIVQGSDRNEALDELGYYLANDIKLPEGQIPNDQIGFIINKSVEFYFKVLEQTINTFSSDLLGFLVGQNEAIVKERISRKLTRPTRNACYQNYEGLIKDINVEERELNDVAISCRFLIEYVISNPPKGFRPVSFTAFDRMMALASEIISRGQESDYFRYGLFDIKLSMLPSGRLGFDNQNNFGEIINSYMSSRSREETDDSIKNFDFWWRPNSQTNKPAISQYLQEFYNVFLDEYGISLAELSTLVSKLEDFSEDFSDGSQLIKFKKNELITKISVLTEWSEQNIERLLDFLSLKPRQNFLEVPPGLSKTDVYPWRMSRELSYARRPIMELKTDDQIYFCWGKRHLYDAFTYIVYGSFGGWLKPYYTSESMQKWLGKKHNEDGKEFTNKVKQISENINGSIIRSEVKKFGAIRLGHPGNDLGDIDVLIVLPRIKSIILIECKNLLVARTPIEMKRELESLFIDTNKSLSTISKVVKRQKWVHDNLKIVLSSLNIDQRGKWEVNSLIVTSDELVSPYFFESSLEVISYLRYIEDYLPTIEDRILKIRN